MILVLNHTEKTAKIKKDKEINPCIRRISQGEDFDKLCFA